MVLVWKVGLVDTKEALSGFSYPGTLANGTLFVVIKGVDRSQHIVCSGSARPFQQDTRG